MTKIALTIAGSDSGGGAGIQADLKTFSALGVYGSSVITAVTAQNTSAVTAVHEIPPAIIAAQIQAVLSDLDVAAIKIGMLANTDIVEAVVESIADFSGPIVVDPVMIAKSGDALLADQAVKTVQQKLIPKSEVLTPNLSEAACLIGDEIANCSVSMQNQGRALCDLGAKTVLMKGGHAKGDVCRDLLIGPDGLIAEYSAPRFKTKNTHGTGCTLSSAIAAGLAKGLSIGDAVGEAHVYLQGAIAKADTLCIGHGHGPVHHFYREWSA